MKSFLLSATALIALCCLVILNGSFIGRASDSMTDAAEKINGISDMKELEALEKIWEKNKTVITLSVPHRVSDEMERCLVLLRTKFDENIDIEISETVALTLRTIEEIKTHATASLDNIF